jgi:hypothetical protein
MSNTNSSTSGGIGFAGLLTIVFITLKLCNVIAWSWWWVLSPILISLGLVLGIIAIVGIIALIAALMSGPKKSKRW